jgi:hypothetical protein
VFLRLNFFFFFLKKKKKKKQQQQQQQFENNKNKEKKTTITEFKKRLPHLVASVPLTSQKRLSFKTAQMLSIAAMLLF